MKCCFIILLFVVHVLRGQVVNEELIVFPEEVKQIILAADRTKSIWMDVVWYDDDRVILDERVRYRFLNDSIIEQRFQEKRRRPEFYYGLIRGAEIIDYDLDSQKVLIYYDEVKPYDSAGFAVYRYEKAYSNDTIYFCTRIKKDQAGGVYIEMKDVSRWTEPIAIKTLIRQEHTGDSVVNMFTYNKQGALWKLTDERMSKRITREGGKFVLDTTIVSDCTPGAVGFGRATIVSRISSSYDEAGRIKLIETVRYNCGKSVPDTSAFANVLAGLGIHGNDTLYLRDVFEYDQAGRIIFVEKQEPGYRYTMHVTYPEPKRRSRARKKVEKKP